MKTVARPDDNPPDPQAATPYFRVLPEPDWRRIDAVTADLGLPPAA